MTVPAASATPLVAPTEICAHVPAELQQRTIRLMAQLAVNLVVTVCPCAETIPTDMEVLYAHSSEPIQDPARPSRTTRADLRPPIHALPGARKYRQHRASTIRYNAHAISAGRASRSSSLIRIKDTRVRPRQVAMGSSFLLRRSVSAALVPSSVWKSRGWRDPVAIGTGCSKFVP